VLLLSLKIRNTSFQECVWTVTGQRSIINYVKVNRKVAPVVQYTRGHCYLVIYEIEITTRWGGGDPGRN
jgi:hypothetical protein